MKEIEKNPNIKLWKDFTWPEQIPLTTRLKDILEKTVDEKYYLSGDKVESILANFIARQNEASGINLKDQATTFDGLTDVAHTLMARDYKGFGNQSMTGVIEPSIIKVGQLDSSFDQSGRVYSAEGIAPTVMSNSHGKTSGGYTSPKILVDENSDKLIKVEVPQTVNVRKYEVDIDALQKLLRDAKSKSSFTNKDIAEKLDQSLTTVEHWFRTDECFSIPSPDVWMSLKELLNITTDDFDESITTVVGTLRTIDACGDKRVIEPGLTQIGTIDGNGHEIRRRVYDADGISPTLCGVGSGGNTEPKVLVKDEDVNPVRIGNIYGKQFGTGYAGNVWDQDSVSPTIMTAQGGNRQPLVVDNVKWRIRKLTPTECWRLMSFSDEDCNRASKYVSDSALYKQAGNSIVTSCLVAIFYSLLFNDNGTNWSDYIVQYKINGGNV